jgi:putative transposon-encoded protein
MQDEMNVVVQGYQVLERKVSKNGTKGRIYLPKTRANKRVKVVLLQPTEDEVEYDKPQ